MLGWFVCLCLPDELIAMGSSWACWGLDRGCSEGKVQGLMLEKHCSALALPQVIKASVITLQTSKEVGWDGWILQICLFVLQVPQKTLPELMAWASVGLGRLCGQSWWASLRRRRRPGKAVKVQRMKKGLLHLFCKCIYQWESGLTLALEIVLWQSPANFITSHPLPLPKLL